MSGFWRRLFGHEDKIDRTVTIKVSTEGVEEAIENINKLAKARISINPKLSAKPTPKTKRKAKA